MAKKLPLISFSLKTIILLHLSLFSIILTHAKTDPHHDSFTFFMHDIVGGSFPSERIVAGIIFNTQTPKLPFSKPNNRVFPIKGSIPIFDTTSTNNNPSPTMAIKNIDKNKVVMDKNSPPLGKFLFGRITVIDDEITKGHEFGSEVIGKAQGFHLASSLDGSSRTMAFTVSFSDENDAISFFGVHRTGTTRESCIAIVGGTGNFDSVKGYAKIETLDLPNQHITNGVEILLQITVYIS